MTSFSLLDSPGRAAVPGRICTLPVDDWDMLFRAVRMRLRLSVGLQPDPEAPTPCQVLRTRAAVLECSKDLERLHAMLVSQRGHEARPAREAVVARRAFPAPAPGMRMWAPDLSSSRLDVV